MLLWHCCPWWSNETLLEMLIWGQWVFVLNSWVSWCFCDTVAPDVQMRTLLEMLIWGQWVFVLNSWVSWMLLWHCCTWCSNETLLEMLIWGQWVFVLNSWVSWCFCDTVAPDVQMRLCWKCWFEGNESLFLIPESPDAVCDTVAPDVQMRLCWKCWFEGNEYLFLIPESPDAIVTLLHLMIKWDFVGNVVLRAMRPYS